MIPTLPTLPLGFIITYSLWLCSLPVLPLYARLGWDDADVTRVHLAGLVTGFALVGIGLGQGAAVAWLAGCAGYTIWMLGGFLRWVQATGRVA